MKCLRFILVFHFLIKTNGEFYSSTDKLRELFAFENETLKFFANIFNEINDIENYLEDKLRPWYDEHKAAQKDVDKYVTNPLNAYLLIKRNAYNVEMMQKKLTSFVDD